MNEPSLPKPQRKLTSLELSAPARGALRRLKRTLGMSFTYAVERGLVLLEHAATIGEPMPPAARQAIGLAPYRKAAPRNRRRPHGKAVAL